jgi:hypothetical protein
MRKIGAGMLKRAPKKMDISRYTTIPLSVIGIVHVQGPSHVVFPIYESQMPVYSFFPPPRK